MLELNDGTVVEDEVEEVYALRKQALKHQREWRREARQAFEFRDGDQWDSEDAAQLEEQQRPVVTFNRCAPIIDSIVGYEQGNRREVRYLPRTMDDAEPNEVFTLTAQWIRDQCDAEDEESDAYSDAVTCGMGWTETRVDYDEEPDGKIVIERVPPTEMMWDPSARKGNVTDAGWVMRETWKDVKEIKERWPGKDIASMHDDAFNDDDWEDEHDSTDAWKYEQDQEWKDPKSGKAKLMHFQRRKREAYYRVSDPQTGQEISLDEKKFKKMEMMLIATGATYVKQHRWAYHQRFITGMTLLEEGPVPAEGHFSYTCITAKRDEKKSYWYGMMRAMRDPQEWANKFFSQTMHILNTNAKGGVMIENDAVDNKREFEETWASSDAVSWVSDGALASGKIQQKDFGGYPSALDKLLAFAISSIRDCTGVNLELMGMANRDQAGIVETERKKAALVILAPLINSLRRYRKNQGRALLTFMRQYIEPGTVMRITDRKQVQFWDDDPTIKFDVIVDTAPTSPNLKEEVWSIMQNIVPAMVKAGVPLPPQLIKFSPLPESVAEEWIKYIEEKSQGIDPEQMKKLQERMEKLMSENMQLKTKQQQHALEIDFKKTSAQIDAQMRAEELAAAKEKTVVETQTKMQIADADRLFKMMELAAEYDIKSDQLEQEARIKREELTTNTGLQRELAQAKKEESVDPNVQRIYEMIEQNQRSAEERRGAIAKFLRDKGLDVPDEVLESSEEPLRTIPDEQETVKMGMLQQTQQTMAQLRQQIESDRQESRQRRQAVAQFLRAKGLDVPEEVVA